MFIRLGWSLFFRFAFVVSCGTGPKEGIIVDEVVQNVRW